MQRDKEHRARGKTQRLPAFETWTPQQQEAGRKLGEILSQMAVRQAFAFTLEHLERMQTEVYSGCDPETEAARRALAELRTGKWKPGRDDVNGLQVAMGWALEALARNPGAKRKSKDRSQHKKRTNRIATHS